jgi:glycosyltransferase involved in cell wall biosynthesis
MKKIYQNNVIIFISDLDFSVTGNQTLLNVILGTLKNGFDVKLITSSPISKESNDKIKIVKEKYPVFEVIRFKPLFRRINRYLPNFNRSNFKKNTHENKEIGYVPFTYYPSLSFLSFFFGGFLTVFNYCNKTKPAYICGYEPRGVLLGSLMSKIFSTKFYTRYQGIILYQELNNPIRMLLKYPFYYLCLKLNSDLIYMGNDGTRGDEVLKWFGVDMNKVRFRINGIDNNISYNKNENTSLLSNFGLDSGSKFILITSRLQLWKRVDRIIHAMPDILISFPDIKLVIVGGGDDELRLKTIVNNLKINNNVIFTGPLNHDDVDKFMNLAIIFVSCYDHSNLCNPVLEALRCGLPVVSINDGSTRSILIDQFNSILISQEDVVKNLTNAIIELLSDDQFRLTLSDNAIEFSKSNILTWEHRMELEHGEL